MSSLALVACAIHESGTALGGTSRRRRKQAPARQEQALKILRSVTYVKRWCLALPHLGSQLHAVT